MSRRVSLLARFLRAVACAALLFAFVPQANAAAGETWEVRGHTYTNVRVREVTAATITIFHGGGVAQLELAKLPQELQERFGYDPENAAAWKRDAESGIAATRETKRRVAEVRAKSASSASATNASAGSGANAPDEVVRVQLQTEVDLRADFQRYGLYLKDQGQRPSCSVFATLGAVEYETARQFGKAEPLSEEFLIWAVHEMQPGIPLDNGYHFETVVFALQTYGVPSQSIMRNTFGRKVADIKPLPEALFDASTRRGIVPVWFRADDPQLLARVVQSLNERTPVVVGLRWPQWRTLAGNHLLRDQKPLAGPGHAVTLIGYRCPTGRVEDLVFIFRNSYGIGWGLGGCGFIAPGYLSANVISAFTITMPSQDASAVAAR